jgi:hypothetical protein
MAWDSIVQRETTPYTAIKRDRYYPPRDRLDRRIPHHMETVGFLRALPGLINFFERRVPPEFWTAGADPMGKEIVTIACRCGEEPVLRWRLRSYSVEECPCGRFFMHDGQDVRVGYDREKVEPDPEDPEPEEAEEEPPMVPPELAETQAVAEPVPDS